LRWDNSCHVVLVDVPCWLGLAAKDNEDTECFDDNVK
jgi:hypothetical protein